MKTLDDAVIELNGVLPSCLKNKLNNENGWYISTRGKVAHSELCVWFDMREFQQRAKELGFVNGYRYGVKHKSDGKKPDLPDDVVIGIDESDYPAGTVDSWVWSKVKFFMITDPHYRPADTSYLEKSDSSVDNVNSASFEVTKAHWENAPVWAVDIRNRFGKLYYTDGNFHCKEVDGSGWCKFYSVTKHPVISERPETVIEYKDDSSTGSNGVEVDMIAQAKHEFSTASRAFQDLFKEPFDKVIANMEMKAKAERKKFIDSGCNITDHLRGVFTSDKAAHDVLCALYDAGFRLPE